MKPKILVSRKISDLAEEKLAKEFDATLNYPIIYSTDHTDWLIGYQQIFLAHVGIAQVCQPF